MNNLSGTSSKTRTRGWKSNQRDSGYRLGKFALAFVSSIFGCERERVWSAGVVVVHAPTATPSGGKRLKLG